MHADVIVIGLGAMGAAITYQLARRGVTVVGIDRYIPPHDLGSTHGDTRVTRHAVGEGPEYVPLVARSHQIWHELAAETGEPVLHPCGVLLLAPPGTGAHGVESFVETTAALARRFGIDHEMLDATSVVCRFPQFALHGGEIGYFEPGAGSPGPSWRCGCSWRRPAGTGQPCGTEPPWYPPTLIPPGSTWLPPTVTGRSPARSWWPPDRGWPTSRPPPLRAQLRVCRQVLYWYHVDHDAYPSLTAPPLPVFLWFRRDAGVYGFPALNGPDGGLKVGYNDYTTTASASAPKMRVSDAEVREMYHDRVGGRIPRRPPATRAGGDLLLHDDLRLIASSSIAARTTTASVRAPPVWATDSNTPPASETPSPS